VNDADWFDANSGKTDRLRPLDDADREGIRRAGLEGDGYNCVLVRQIAPGVRARIYGWFDALTETENEGRTAA